MSPWARVIMRLRARPAPAFLVALWLSLRWRCLVSPSAKVRFPGAVRLGPGVRLRDCTVIAQGRGVDLAAGVELQDGVILDTQGGGISIGKGTAIGPYTIVYGYAGVSIGDECSIAGHSMIVSSSHVTDRVDIPIRRQGARGAAISIGDDVWIGAQCVVIAGASIAAGAVIGANSVVRGEIPAFAVAAGTPATVRRVRSGA